MLKIIDLVKKYGEKTAVDGINLVVDKGETVVVMGPSGCGKSTSIRCINRLTEPTSGEIIFQGTKLTALPPAALLQIRKRIGFVFQQFNLVQRLTALENVMLGLVAGGMDKGDALTRANEALATVGMEKHAGQRPGEMSGGQQQRVGIARALALEPEMMLWDEPTASLDPILVGEVLEVMEDLAKSKNMTMVVVTHELPFALHVADRIILMDKGRIVEEGMPQAVFANPQSKIGEQYRRLIDYQLNMTGLKIHGKKVVA
ncbi:MAG: amino acid ABC transporter ATP-binding protein [Bacillota bacterium]